MYDRAPWTCPWSCKLIDGLSLWESDEMGKQKTKRKMMNNAIDLLLSISEMGFGGFAATVSKPNVCIYISHLCVSGDQRQNMS